MKEKVKVANGKILICIDGVWYNAASITNFTYGEIKLANDAMHLGFTSLKVCPEDEMVYFADGNLIYPAKDGMYTSMLSWDTETFEVPLEVVAGEC